MKCPCGQDHPAHSSTEEYLQNYIDLLGPDIPIHCEGVTYLVPRVYIAFHGLKGAELPELTKRHSFIRRKDESAGKPD